MVEFKVILPTEGRPKLGQKSRGQNTLTLGPCSSSHFGPVRESPKQTLQQDQHPQHDQPISRSNNINYQIAYQNYIWIVDKMHQQYFWPYKRPCFIEVTEVSISLDYRTSFIVLQLSELQITARLIHLSLCHHALPICSSGCCRHHYWCCS